jgi:hypothetical protein
MTRITYIACALALLLLALPSPARSGELITGIDLGYDIMLSEDDEVGKLIDTSGLLAGVTAKYLMDPTVAYVGQPGIGFTYFYADHEGKTNGYGGGGVIDVKEYQYKGFVFEALYDFEESRGVSIYGAAGLGYWESNFNFASSPAGLTTEHLEEEDGLLASAGLGGAFAIPGTYGATIGADIRFMYLGFSDLDTPNFLLRTTAFIGWTFDFGQAAGGGFGEYY